MIVAIEGVDASGKATQSKILAEALGATRFENPSYSNHDFALSGPFIADHLKNQWQAVPNYANAMLPDQVKRYERLDAHVFQCLMAINKYELAPAIKGAEHAVLDRYWQSAYAYGVADGLDKEWLYRIHSSLPRPDLNVLLDIEPEVSVRRRPDRRDRYEQKGLDFFRHLRLNYLELWHYGERRLGGEWLVVDGSQPVEKVTEEISRAVERCG